MGYFITIAVLLYVYARRARPYIGGRGISIPNDACNHEI